MLLWQATSWVKKNTREGHTDFTCIELGDYQKTWILRYHQVIFVRNISLRSSVIHSVEIAMFDKYTQNFGKKIMPNKLPTLDKKSMFEVPLRCSLHTFDWNNYPRFVTNRKTQLVEGLQKQSFISINHLWRTGICKLRINQISNAILVHHKSVSFVGCANIAMFDRLTTTFGINNQFWKCNS